MNTCTNCKGTGKRNTKCKYCKKGWVKGSEGLEMCWICKGTAYKGENCTSCNGRGLIFNRTTDGRIRSIH